MKSLIDLSPAFLYLITFGMSFVISLLLTPLCRVIAIKFGILDHPHSDIKTHRVPTPYLGGIAIWLGWMISLFVIRLFTNFPTGTLHNLRGVFVGSTIILMLGLIDDIVPKGLGFKKKFVVQTAAAIALLFFDIRLHFITPSIAAAFLSIFWVVGISNAFNIVDIMDGLSGGLALIASLAFLFISLPTEQIYVNFCAVALAGGCLGFLPFNLSKKNKIFMGDTGSLTIGFILAAISLGTSYSKINGFAVMAPLLILAIPMYDTVLVSFLRLKKGQSPFLGSKDHFALRLEILGYSRKQILLLTYSAGTLLACGAFLVTRFSLLWAGILLALLFWIALRTGSWIARVKID